MLPLETVHHAPGRDGGIHPLAGMLPHPYGWLVVYRTPVTVVRRGLRGPRGSKTRVVREQMRARVVPATEITIRRTP